MTRTLKAFLANQQGSAIVLFSLAMVSFLAIIGLVIDGGKLYVTKAHLQKVANAAALSGAQELLNSESQVHSVIVKVLESHQEEASLVKEDILIEKKVSIDLEKNTSLTFSKLLGYDNVSVKAHAAAELRVMGRAVGAAPLGIDDSIPLEFFQEYKLKVDQTGVEYGNFGVLALGGSGAKTYEENLRYGYQEEIKIGDTLDTQTGNIAGKTRAVIQDLIASCPYLPGDYNQRDCPRILLIPLYTPYNHTTNQLKEVKVTGFAFFYITEPMSMKDTSITGMFIKRAGTGFEEAGAINKGAYSIRLTE